MIMKEYLLIFRMDITSAEMQPTAEQMKGYMQQWMAWISEIDGSDRLAEGGNHLSKQGRVLRSGKRITEGPFVENHQSIAGITTWSATGIIAVADCTGGEKSLIGHESGALDLQAIGTYRVGTVLQV
jgi:hypothetical protein